MISREVLEAWQQARADDGWFFGSDGVWLTNDYSGVTFETSSLVGDSPTRETIRGAFIWPIFLRIQEWFREREADEGFYEPYGLDKLTPDAILKADIALTALERNKEVKEG